MSEYQNQAGRTAIHPIDQDVQGVDIGTLYTVMGLSGETGEALEKVKKAIRTSDPEQVEEYLSQLDDEIGDILWYIARLARMRGLNLNDVAEDNLDKLFDRKERNVVDGQGDNR